MSSTKANLLLLLTSLMWGIGFVVTQMALDAKMTPFQLIACRFFVAAIGLNILFYKKFAKLGKNEFISGIIIGSCMLMGFIFQTFGLKHSSPSVCAFVTAIYVVMVPFFNRMIYKKPLDAFAIIGACLTVIGVTFISVSEELTVSLGVPLVLISAIAFALQIITTDTYAKKIDPGALTIVMVNFCFIVSLVIMIIMAIVFDDIPSFSFKAAGSIVYLGLFSTALGFLCQNYAQKYTQATSAAIIFSMEAVFGALASIIFYKEIVTFKMIIGSIIIFIAILLSETKLEFIRKKYKEN